MCGVFNAIKLGFGFVGRENGDYPTFFRQSMRLTVCCQTSEMSAGKVLGAGLK